MRPPSKDRMRAIDAELASHAAGKLHSELGMLFEQGSRLMDPQFLEEITATMVRVGIAPPLADAVRARLQARFFGQSVELFEALTVIKCQL